MEGLAEEGDEGSQDVQEVSGEQVAAMHFNYEEWDVSRYKRAKTEKARGLFWASASDEAKRKMTGALLHEPAGKALDPILTRIFSPMFSCTLCIHLWQVVCIA